MIRKSIAVIAFGFVMAKFGAWLREFEMRLAPQSPMRGTRMSLPMGVAMMAFRGALPVRVGWH
jgi:uncharacterized membrane protein YidH (DUF202 family)